MNTKVFIVDDHYMIVEGIKSMLQNTHGIEWMGHAMTAASCIAFLTKHRPDVILMDINLPDMSGIDLCKEVKTKYPEVKVLGLSSFNQQSFIQKMMDSGASGYILKNVTREEILEAMGTVLKGGKYLSHEAVSTILQNGDSNKPVLTRREKEVLALIADGLTNHEIADKLFVSTTTVDSHRKNLMTKFNASNTAILIRLAAQFQFI
jgi:DNA-binding NarL/FixJ family response regulator